MKKIALSLILLAGFAMANEANATEANATAKAETNATAATEANATAAAGNPEKGKALYARCAACHGADGKLKALGKSAPIAGLPAEQIIKDLEGYKAGTLNKYGLGATMKSQVATLSEQDIKDLAAYISSLK